MIERYLAGLITTQVPWVLVDLDRVKIGPTVLRERMHESEHGIAGRSELFFPAAALHAIAPQNQVHLLVPLAPEQRPQSPLALTGSSIQTAQASFGEGRSCSCISPSEYSTRDTYEPLATRS